MKKIFRLVMVSAIMIALVGCGSKVAETPKGEAPNEGITNEQEADTDTSIGESKIVGVSMPSKSLQRWVQDGESLQAQLEELGYKVDLQYANDVVQDQVSQIENMITKGANVIVIAAVDGDALTDVVSKAADEGIRIISYDRLISGIEGPTYYATFDNYKVGEIQGEYIVEQLNLAAGDGPFNIELFGGSPDNNNAYFFYDGAMSILQPYIDNGQLIVKSGQEGMDVVSTLAWDAAKAQARMDNLISSNYTDDQIHAALTPNDAIARGVISSLKSVGYGSDELPLPITTGQDAEIASVKSMLAGEQKMTVFKDTRELARQVVIIINSILQGEEPEVNDTTSYDNGVQIVPSYLLDPIAVDLDNYKEVLIDSGYYTEDELQ